MDDFGVNQASALSWRNRLVDTALLTSFAKVSLMAIVSSLCIADFAKRLILVALSLLLTSSAFADAVGGEKAGRERNNVMAVHIDIVTPHEDGEIKDFTTGFTKILWRNWLGVMPEDAQLGAAGVVVIRFKINKDRSQSLGPPVVEQSPGEKLNSLTKAALNALRDSTKSKHLPAGFTYSGIELRATFYYNQPAESVKR
jgi:hypothetical protein